MFIQIATTLLESREGNIINMDIEDERNTEIMEEVKV